MVRYVWTGSFSETRFIYMFSGPNVNGMNNRFVETKQTIVFFHDIVHECSWCPRAKWKSCLLVMNEFVWKIVAQLWSLVGCRRSRGRRWRTRCGQFEPSSGTLLRGRRLTLPSLTLNFRLLLIKYTAAGECVSRSRSSHSTLADT